MVNIQAMWREEEMELGYLIENGKAVALGNLQFTSPWRNVCDT